MHVIYRIWHFLIIIEIIISYLRRPSSNLKRGIENQETHFQLKLQEKEIVKLNVL